MPKGIPNKKPAPAVVDPDEAEFARLLAEEKAALETGEQAKADAAYAEMLEAAKAEAYAAGVAAAKAEAAAYRAEIAARPPVANEVVKVLLDQAAVLGLTFDEGMSADEMALAVLEAQEAAKIAAKRAFAAASKEWVFLLRDAFPIEDEKHKAGETIEVTPELADKWYEAGVARPSRNAG